MSIVGSQALKEWFVEDDFFNSHYQHNWTPLSLANGWPIIRRFGSFFFEKMQVKLHKDEIIYVKSLII